MAEVAAIQIQPPLRVGDILGTDEDPFVWELSQEPGPFRVEAIGSDWVIARQADRAYGFAPFCFVGPPERLIGNRHTQ